MVDANNLIQAQRSDQYPVEFVEIIINVDPNDDTKTSIVRISNYHGNLEFNNKTFKGTGRFLTFSGLTDDINIRDKPLTLTLSGVKNTNDENGNFADKFLASNIEGSKVTLYRGWINEDGELLPNPDEIWGGFVSSSTMQDDYQFLNADAITISVECRSLLETLLASKSGRFTSSDSFKLFNSNDRSMDFVGEMNTKEFAFGQS